MCGSLVGKYGKVTFSYPGGCDIGARPIDLHLKAFEKLGINIQKNYGNITCICDKIIGSVSLRGREQGDSIRPKGRNCTKTLKKLFNEMKIPEDKRILYPVIADDAGIIGVAGICADERVGIDEKTKNVLLISITEQEDKN